MANNIGSMAIMITGNASDFSASLKKASQDANSFKQNIAKSTAGMQLGDPLANKIKPEKFILAKQSAYADAGKKSGISFADSLVSAIAGGITTVALSGILNLSSRIAGGVSEIAVESVKMAAEIEDASVTFGVLYNNADKAKFVIKDLRDLAAKTPLTSKELIGGGTLLAGSGIDAEQLRPTLSMLGDISSVSGRPLREMVVIYNQVLSKGRLMATETLQFAEHQINLNELLANSLGKTTSEIIQMTEEGKISAGMFQKALFESTQSGGRFFGMMEERSKTFNGLLSTMRDGWETMLAKIGERIIDKFELKPLMERVSIFFDMVGEDASKLDPILESTAEILATIGQTAATAFLSGVIAIGEMIDKLKELKGTYDYFASKGQAVTNAFAIAYNPQALAATNGGDQNRAKNFGELMAGAEGDIGKYFAVFRESLADLKSARLKKRNIFGIEDAKGEETDTLLHPELAKFTDGNSIFETMAKSLLVDNAILQDKTNALAGVFGNLAVVTGEYGKVTEKVKFKADSLTADQIKRARDIREDMNPLDKFKRQADELNSIRRLGGFTPSGTASMFRAATDVGAIPNDVFSFALSKAFEPIMKEFQSDNKRASTAQRGSEEAAKIIADSQFDQRSEAQKQTEAMINMKTAMEQMAIANKELAKALMANPILQVK